ncbi:MAG TPA: O-antigen ligase family protein [Terriglobales bacterium]|nr:O-antigen ligase family protein [Terriglobales bacterium]
MDAAATHVFGWRGFHDKKFWVVWLEHAIYFALLALLVAEPFSTHSVLFIFRIALGLWGLKLVLTGFRVQTDRLSLPLLLFLLGVGVSTVFSYAPLLSWERMGWYSLALIFFLVTQNVKTGAQLKWLVLVLLLSSSVTAIQTGWQFTAGIGTKLLYVAPGPMRDAGLRPGDIVREINGHSVRRLWLWGRALRLTERDSVLRMHVARRFPGGLNSYYTTVPRAVIEEWLRTPGQLVSNGYPPRAQGHFYHAIPYAGMLMEIAALCWGLLLASGCAKPGKRVLLLLIFVGLGASLWATVTRSYVLALMAGCLAAVWLATRWKMRVLAILAVVAVLVAGSFWIRDQRHLSWFSSREPGTEFRMMMWKDSPSLVREHPLLGIGLDSVQLPGNRFDLKAYRVFPLKHAHFHSTYIELAVDCGLPVLGLWLWLMVAYFRHLRRLLRLSTQAKWFYQGLALGIFASALAFYLGCLVQYTLGDGEVMPLVWLFMGCSVVLYRLLQAQPARVEVG